MVDKHEVKIKDGSIINIHQTVNGENLFVVFIRNETMNIIEVRYARDLNTVYEYDLNDLLEINTLIEGKEVEVVGNIYDHLETIRKYC